MADASKKPPVERVEAGGGFKQKGHQHRELFRLAQTDPEAYWGQQAANIAWQRPFSRVLSGSTPEYEWFADGSLNLSYNCLDRHMPHLASKTALLWADEQGSERAVSYGQLFEDVQRCANGLKSLGVKKGDRVAIYMPMIPEALVAMLACVRIGAIHTVVFAGFSSHALAERMQDAGCRLLITADSFVRKGKDIALKEQVDAAVAACPDVAHLLIVKHSGKDIAFHQERDVWYHELLAAADPVCEALPLEAEDPSFILYTSGTTGKPKGIVHSTGGYAVGAYTTMAQVFDIASDDIFWCTADIGWITGHTYVAYGPLLHGVTQVIYEGAPSHPHNGIIWELIERYKVSIFYTAPTAIRLFSKWGDQVPVAYDLSSLRLLGSVGEPLNPEVWRWYYTHIGYTNCPIVDTWWQTETGSIMITTMPSVDAMRPGYAGKPLPGTQAQLINDAGQPITKGAGMLALTQPWPSMMRGIWGDTARFEQYFHPTTNDFMYVTGDAASCDDEGNHMIIGRIDDVLNVSGHRLGTMELESAIVDHPTVAEVAVVPKPHELKGQAVVAFVVLREGQQASDELKYMLQQHVVQQIGAIARPDKIIFTHDLPKTRSGKIMRRLLREIVYDVPLSDMTTLANQEVVHALREQYQYE